MTVINSGHRPETGVADSGTAAPVTTCLACGDDAQGDLVCVRCDIREDAKARRREDL